MRSTTSPRRPAVADRGRCSEAGTAFVLAPALVLVMVALGAIAVDLSVLHAAQRSVGRVASSAADDAAGMIDQRSLQLRGEVGVDAESAGRLVRDRFDSTTLPGRLVALDVVVDGDRVEVSATVEVDHVFLRALPGHADSETVRVRTAGRLLR